MPEPGQIVIIGGGVNGLTAALYFARAGLKPLVLERRDVVGGTAVTEEISPGFRCPTLAHAAGPLAPQVIAETGLAKFALETVEPPVQVFAPTLDGRALEIPSDPRRRSERIAAFSKKDAERFAEFEASLARMAHVVGRFLLEPPPAVDALLPGDVWNLLRLGKDIRSLGEKEMYRLLAWGPKAVADVVTDWFESEPLRAVVAARGIFGSFLGPRSAGSTAVLLTRAALDPSAAGSLSHVKGGPGALTQALARAVVEAGGEIRAGAEIAQVTVKNGCASGVALANGETIEARAVVSSADPKRTFLRLVDPAHLETEFLARIQNYRSMGVVGKINLALGRLPTFQALRGASDATLSGRIHIGPSLDDLEHAFDDAKYGRFSSRPYLEVTIPSLTDPSLAPAGRHVMSIVVQYAPFRLRDGDWTTRRDEWADSVIRTLAEYAPDLSECVEARQVITPRDLEETYSLTGGHIFHGELGLDQLFAMRPLFGWARYRTPIAGLYLCGSGTHPGTGLNGLSGRNAAREILKELKKR